MNTFSLTIFLVLTIGGLCQREIKTIIIGIQVFILKEQFLKDSAKEEFAFVFFTDNRCSKCESLWQIFKSACIQIMPGSPDYSEVPCIKVIIDNEDQAKQLQIQGYPTVKFYLNGTENGIEYQFTGLFNSDPTRDMEIWASNIAGYYLNEIETESEIKMFPQGFNISVLFLQKPKAALQSSEESIEAIQQFNKEHFRTVARMFKNQRIVGLQYTQLDSMVRQHYNIPEDVSLILWRDRGEGGKYMYKGEMDIKNVFNFINHLIHENWFIFNEKSLDHIFYYDQLKLPTVFLVVQGNELKPQSQLKILVNKFKESFNFVYTPYIKDDTQILRLLTFLGIQQNQIPRIAIYNHQTQLRYNDNSDDIELFLRKYLNKTLSALYRSQDMPSISYVGITSIVGKDFQKHKKDALVPVVIIWGASWCSYSQNFMTQCSKLGKVFEGLYTFLYLDGSVNDIEGHQIDAFPTTKLYFPGQNRFIEYRGDLNFEQMKQFLSKYVSKKQEDIHNEL